MSAYYSRVHRLTDMLLIRYHFNKELNIIEQITANNVYKPNSIEKLVMLNKKTML